MEDSEIVSRDELQVLGATLRPMGKVGAEGDTVTTIFVQELVFVVVVNTKFIQSSWASAPRA